MHAKPTHYLLCLLATAVIACNNQTNGTDKAEPTTNAVNNKPQVKEEAVSYMADSATLNSYVAYDESKPGRRPVVLVVPEWWGLTEYPRMRAKMLAEMGYFAMAVDIYGEGKLAESPADAQAAATPFYTNPQKAKSRLDAALAKAASFAQADTGKLAAIGYCFGGSMVLNYAKMGAPVAGVVSFHGGLQGVPPQKGTTAKFLVCHGGADDFVPPQEVDAFKKSMDAAGLSYDFKVYDSATHAFTNPGATAKGQQFNMPIRYNGKADTASWNDMKVFLSRLLQ